MSPSRHSKATPEEVVRAVMDCAERGIMGDRSALDDIAELYAEPTYVLHPLQPSVPPLITREDFRRHADSIGSRGPRPGSHRAADVVVHQTTDPEVVVTEFHYETVMGGATWITPCIWVTRVRDGRIVESHDYNGTAYPAA